MLQHIPQDEDEAFASLMPVLFGSHEELRPVLIHARNETGYFPMVKSRYDLARTSPLAICNYNLYRVPRQWSIMVQDQSQDKI